MINKLKAQYACRVYKIRTISHIDKTHLSSLHYLKYFVSQTLLTTEYIMQHKRINETQIT